MKVFLLSYVLNCVWNDILDVAHVLNVAHVVHVFHVFHNFHIFHVLNTYSMFPNLGWLRNSQNAALARWDRQITPTRLPRLLEHL